MRHLKGKPYLSHRFKYELSNLDFEKDEDNQRRQCAGYIANLPFSYVIQQIHCPYNQIHY